VARTRTFFISDLTNSLIQDEAEKVRIIVEEHPQLSSGPVELVGTKSELKGLDGEEVSIARLTLHEEGEVPRTINVPVDVFNALSTEASMSDVLAEGLPVLGSEAKPRRGGDKVDYSSLEHAGKPHRGKTTDAEKKTVRQNLVAINERLARDGMRKIDPNNPEHCERYGLADMAQ
jgi:hypothetical protein